MIELLPVVALVLKRDVMQRPLRARKANATPSSGAASWRQGADLASPALHAHGMSRLAAPSTERVVDTFVRWTRQPPV